MGDTKKKRGFAAMDPETVREYARRGGQAVQAAGRGHRWTSDEAKAAGKLGVEAKKAAS